jgi:hypothetical protein
MARKKTKRSKSRIKPKPAAPPEHGRASDAKIAQRVAVILQLKLDGAEPWNIRDFVSAKEQAGEPPWTMDADQKPLSDSTIRRYIAAADERICEESLSQEKTAMHRHLCQRRGLYARALEAGELGTALAVLRDLALLADLYPSARTVVAGDKANPLFLHHTGNVTHDPTLEAADAAFAESLADSVLDSVTDPGTDAGADSAAD